jgi:L-asparaginase II
MSGPGFRPLYRFARGGHTESVHHGAVAVVDASGRLMASAGDPYTSTYLRSAAKPFQALPIVQASVQGAIELETREIAVICASHSGTDAHVAVIQGLQARFGIREDDLLCGVHPPFDPETQQALQSRGEDPTPNRHNCSGKHTGMLVYARLRGWPSADYIDPAHPLQSEILEACALLCGLPPEKIGVGVDGCSAPNFALPLYHAALAFARLGDPSELPEVTAQACRRITAAMRAHPELVSGPGRFDTRLMAAGKGRLVAKGGAEGYQGVGLLPGALGDGAPAVGVAVKIADGDLRGRALPGVVVEVLRQLGALDSAARKTLSEFGPNRPVYNWRKLVVGEAGPCFTLETPQSLSKELG